MEKVQTFTSMYSYGHLEEWLDFKEFIMNIYIRKEYRVFFMLPISDYLDGENMSIEGEMILKRKWIFFFDIEKVTFYEGGEEERFLKDFLGI